MDVKPKPKVATNPRRVTCQACLDLREASRVKAKTTFAKIIAGMP